MASDPKSKIPYLLERLAQGVAAHDRENPGHHTWGIGMANFDIERLDLDEGEEILPGIVLQADGGPTGAFRVLCDGNHGAGLEEEEEETIDAVADADEEFAEEQDDRELVPVRPDGPGWPEREREHDGDQPPRIRPPF